MCVGVGVIYSRWAVVTREVEGVVEPGEAYQSRAADVSTPQLPTIGPHHLVTQNKTPSRKIDKRRGV